MLSVIRLNNKMVNRLKKLPYEIRLKRLGIYTQERQRLRGDLIETFKILTGKERIDYKKFFWISRCYQLAQRTFIEIIQAKMSQHDDKTASASGSSMNGTNSHSLSLKHHLSMPSKTGWTYWSDMGDHWLQLAWLHNPSTSSTSKTAFLNCLHESFVLTMWSLHVDIDNVHYN